MGSRHTTIKPIEKALTKIQNRFLLTAATSLRWENLIAGAPPLVEVPRAKKSRIDVVLDEIIAGRVEVDEAELTLKLSGQPQIEEHSEPTFSAPISPEPPAPPSRRGRHD